MRVLKMLLISHYHRALVVAFDFQAFPVFQVKALIATINDCDETQHNVRSGISSWWVRVDKKQMQFLAVT